MPVTLIVNPTAGRGVGVARAADVARLLAPLGTVTPVFAPSLQALTAAARTAATSGHIIIILGGDGTVHHVVNALRGTPTTIGILPSGSGNDLARALGLPLDLETAARRLALGRTRRVDLAEVNGRVFCTVGGTGLIAGSTADVSRWTAPRSRVRNVARWLGGNAYLVSAGARILFGRSLELMHVSGDGPLGVWSWEGAAHAVLVANQRAMGAGMTLPVAAVDDDGVLESCIVPRRGRVSLAVKLIALRTGRPLPAEVLRVERATSMRIDCGRPCAFVADGEVLFDQDRSFVVRVRVAALQVLV